jgi:hypothetical protein
LHGHEPASASHGKNLTPATAPEACSK